MSVYKFRNNFSFIFLFRINTKIMFERIPSLGLVIDLTNTKKYYHSKVLYNRSKMGELQNLTNFLCFKNVTDLGIEYKKIFVPGHHLPGQHIYDE